jgi:hypothetical protein
MKMAAFWVVALCSLVEVSQALAAFIIRAIVLMMETASFSETSVNYCQITRRNTQEDSHLQSTMG